MSRSRACVDVVSRAPADCPVNLPGRGRQLVRGHAVIESTGSKLNAVVTTLSPWRYGVRPHHGTERSSARVRRGRPDQHADHGAPGNTLPDRDRWSGLMVAVLVGADG